LTDDHQILEQDNGELREDVVHKHELDGSEESLHDEIIGALRPGSPGSVSGSDRAGEEDGPVPKTLLRDEGRASMARPGLA
jgi:hypothetical protein